MEGQLSLFDTKEALAKQLSVEQKKVAVKAYKKVPHQPGIRVEMFSSLPKEIEEYVIPPEESYSFCGTPRKVIGKEIVRTETVIIFLMRESQKLLNPEDASVVFLIWKIPIFIICMWEKMYEVNQQGEVENEEKFID